MYYNSSTGEFEGPMGGGGGGGNDGPGCFTIAAIVFGIIAVISLIMSLFF